MHDATIKKAWSVVCGTQHFDTDDGIVIFEPLMFGWKI